MSFTSVRRDVALVAAAKAISLLGDEMATIALMLRLQSGGAGAPAVAALLMANLLPIVLLSGVVGRMIDRVDSRMLLLTSGLAQALVCLGLAFAGPTPAVLGLILVLGAGQAVNGATWQALLPAIAGTEGLPRAISTVQLCTTTAGIVAPALSGILTGSFGARVPLLIDAATFLAISVAALLLGARTQRDPVDGTRRQGGFAIVRRDALLAPLFVLVALFILLGSMVNVVDVFLVRGVLGASATAYGFVGACFALGMLVGAAGSGRFAGGVAGFPRLARLFVGACTLLGLGLAGLGLAPDVAVLLPISFVSGLGNGAVNVALGSLVMGRAAAGERGRVAAALTGTSSGCQLAAYAIGAGASGLLGPRALFVLAGCLGLLAPLLLGRRLIRAADWAACLPTTPPATSPPSAGASLPRAASPTPSPTT